MRAAVSSLVLVALIAHAAEPAPVTPPPAAPPSARLLPPLTDVPEGGQLDADLVAAVDAARAQLDGGDPTGAVQKLMALVSSNDRFTHAQRAGLAELAAKVLRDAGKALAAQGHLQEAAQAYDSAWTATGRKSDPEYAVVLVDWARQRRLAAPKEALWMVRRARAADPANAAAGELDFDWSHNGLRWPAWLSIGFGVASIITGFATWQVGDTAKKHIDEAVLLPRAQLDGYLTTMHQMGVVSTSANILGGALVVLGLVLMFVGQPIAGPLSPDTLPALEGR
ncbi:MAG: hypothetical protein QM723_01480 [Myxococcaceae bacterium]